MTMLRNALILAIAGVAFLLIIRWSEFQDAKYEDVAQEETLASNVPAIVTDTPRQLDETSETPAALIATEQNGDTALPEALQENPTTNAQLIHIETDTLSVIIDTFGGDIVRAALPAYPNDIDTPDEPFVMLDRTKSHTYVARSGLVGPNGTDTGKSRPVFSVTARDFTLSDNEDQLVVDLTTQQDAVTITKRFTFNRGSYLIDIDYLVDNQSNENWSAALFGQIRRDSFKPRSDIIGMQPYVGAAITTPEKNYKKLSFGDIKDDSFSSTHEDGWVAMIQHYFVSAWIPASENEYRYDIRKVSNKDLYLLEFTGKLQNVSAGSQTTLSTQFYVGPKVIKELAEVSPHLDLTIDFSWLWMVAKPLFLALDFIHSFVGNWGVAIILLTLLIKIVFLWPSAMSYKSMAKMRKLQPMMTDLRERFGDDRQKMSAELMKLYRKEKINPLGGCLPILIQMPVFIALYWVLLESVELRQAPFFLWITDLSIKDPFFILPVLMAGSMFIQQKLNPTPPDPMQAKIMQMLPLVFGVMFAFFPAGLVLYWVVNNTLSIAQQYFITKQVENA